jgi:hypothetical protein
VRNCHVAYRGTQELLGVSGGSAPGGFEVLVSELTVRCIRTHSHKVGQTGTEAGRKEETDKGAMPLWFSSVPGLAIALFIGVLII